MSVIGYTIWYLITIFTWGVYLEKTLQLLKKNIPIKRLFLLTLGIIPLAWLLELFFIFGIIADNHDNLSLLIASLFSACFFSHWGINIRTALSKNTNQLNRQLVGNMTSLFKHLSKR